MIILHSLFIVNMTTTTTAIPETTRTTTMNTNTSTAIPGNFLKNLNETKTVRSFIMNFPF